MTVRRRGIAVLTSMLLVAAPGVALGEEDGAVAAIESAAPEPAALDPEPYLVCLDGMCRVTDEPRADDPSAVEAALTPEGDAAGLIVCSEGGGDCSIVDPGTSIEDLLATTDGRLVYGADDSDPSGTWRFTNRPARVRCKIEGAGTSSVKLKRTRDRGTIEQQADGNLIGKSRRADEPPFLMVRLGPGLYGSIQRFAQDNVTGVIVSYYGLLSADKIAGTALVTSTLRDGGPRTDCVLKRNFDMKRISGPPEDEAVLVPESSGEPGAGEDAEATE